MTKATSFGNSLRMEPEHPKSPAWCLAKPGHHMQNSTS